MEKLAERFILFLSKNNENLDPNSKDFKKMKYVVWVFLDELTKFLPYGLFFALIGKLPEYLFAIAVLCPLRIIAGGYHTKTYWGCFFLTFSTFFAVIYLGIYFPLDITIKASIFIVGLISIFFMAPVDNPNMPILREELKKGRRKIAVILFSVIGTMAVIINHHFANIAIWLLIVQILSLPAGIIMNKIHSRKTASIVSVTTS